MIDLMVEAALRSLLVAVAVWAGLRAFRVRNVLAQKACWGLVLASSLLMPFLVRWAARWQVTQNGAALILPLQPLPWFQTAQLSSAVASSTAPVPVKDASASAPIQASAAFYRPQRRTHHAKPVEAESAALTTSSLSVSGFTGDEPAAHAFAAPQPTPVQPLSIARIAWMVYFAVAGAWLIRLLYGLACSLMLWSNAGPVPAAVAAEFAAGVPLRSSRAVASPVTIGSGVVLPHDYIQWDRAKLRIVLAHERSHIRQGDFYLQLLAAFYAAVVWFSPLGWWLKRELSDLAETISDRAGLEQAASLSSYAQILLEFAAAPRPTPVGVAMARPGSLSRRIERLLNDSAFAQAFAGGRRRVLVAVVLVPVALYAATAMVRVQAAQQIPAAQPAPASEPAPAAPSSPAAQPAQAAEVAPIEGQANPPEAITATPEVQPGIDVGTDGPVAPDVVGPIVIAPNVRVRVAPVVPIAPAAPIVRVAPMIHVSPVIPVVPTMRVAPMMPVIPMFAIHMAPGIALGQAFAFAQDNKVYGDESEYHFFHNGESYAIIRGDRRESMNFSGDLHTSDIDKARKLAHGDFLWFAHDGKSYFVDDAATLQKIEDMYKPMDELGKQQEVLGKRQEELGKQQEALGRQQEQASVPTPDLRREMAEITDAMSKLQDKMGKSITQDELSDLQNKLGELQGRLGEIQGEIGGKQGEFGRQQGQLGEQQGRLGAEQGRLGAEQGRLAMKADQAVRGIILESLHNGKARPVE